MARTSAPSHREPPEGHRDLARGSAASRIPSPRNVKPTIISTIASDGNTSVHHAIPARLADAWTIWPSDDTGADGPRPRKLTLASASTHHASDRLTWTARIPEMF